MSIISNSSKQAKKSFAYIKDNFLQPEAAPITDQENGHWQSTVDIQLKRLAAKFQPITVIAISEHWLYNNLYPGDVKMRRSFTMLFASAELRR